MHEIRYFKLSSIERAYTYYGICFCFFLNIYINIVSINIAFFARNTLTCARTSFNYLLFRYYQSYSNIFSACVANKEHSCVLKVHS